MTTRPSYKVYHGSLQERYFASRAKVQMYAGGFANGKTSALCVKVLQLAKDYPGANMLVARSTYPKLNDTVRKELFKWLPPKWKKSFSESDNTLVLQNGTVINFRYVAQQGKKAESTTSNLLSANYDVVAIDQMDDPEITYKDFLDLLGRLRGTTAYVGDDPSMPRTGPRWMLPTCNPTRNWVYRRVVMPLHTYQRTKRKTDDLLVDAATGTPIIELFEGSTLDNSDNLPADYIETLKSSYKGQMYDRFVMGQWGAYEGLVYPEFDPTLHLVPQDAMKEHFLKEQREYRIKPLQGFDYGTAVPSCYLVGFTDHYGNVCIMDGMYKAELLVEDIAHKIKRIREPFGVTTPIHADPSIFRRLGGVGATIADQFAEQGVMMIRGMNSITAGINKVRTHLAPQKMLYNPFTQTYGGARLYLSDHLTWWVDEVSDYMWAKDATGEKTDEPRDVNDHAMDATKYLLTPRAAIAILLPTPNQDRPAYMRWSDRDSIERDERITSRHAS